MFKFELVSFIIILLMVIFSFLISFYVIRRIRNNLTKGEVKGYKAFGITEILLGLIFMVTSVFLFAFIQRDINNAISVLRPISVMTSEPVKLLLIALFLAGLSILIIGANYIRFHKKIPLDE